MRLKKKRRKQQRENEVEGTRDRDLRSSLWFLFVRQVGNCIVSDGEGRTLETHQCCRMRLTMLFDIVQ